MAVIAVAIKLGSRGPVFYRHERVGLRGRPFTLLEVPLHGRRQRRQSVHRDLRHRIRATATRQASTSATPRSTCRSSRSPTTTASPASAAFCASTRSTSCRSSGTSCEGDMSLVGPRPAAALRGRRVHRVAPPAAARRYPASPVCGRSPAAAASASTRWSSRTSSTAANQSPAGRRASSACAPSRRGSDGPRGGVTRTSAIGCVRPHDASTVALVGYGYWGPNLLRNYMELPGADRQVGLRPAPGGARQGPDAATRRVRVTTDFDDVLGRPRGRRRAHRHADLHPLPARQGGPARPASTCSSRSR